MSEDILTNLKSEQGISFIAGVKVDEKLFFSSHKYRGVLCADDKGNIYPIGDSVKKGIAYEFGFQYHDEMWFVPINYEDGILIYNIVNENIEKVYLPKSSKKCLNRAFVGYEITDDIVWLFPGNYDSILEINVVGRVFKRHNMKMESNLYESEEAVFVNAICVQENIYLCPWNLNKIVVFNVREKSFRTLSQNLKERTYRTILEDSGYLYLIGRNRNETILKLDLDGKQVGTIEVPQNINGTSLGAIVHEGHLIEFPWEAKSYLDINIKTKSVVEKEIYIEGKKLTEDAKYFEPRKQNEEILFSTMNRHLPLIVFTKEKKFSTYALKEKSELFLELLIEKISEKKPKNSHVENIGLEIYRTVVNNVQIVLNELIE